MALISTFILTQIIEIYNSQLQIKLNHQRKIIRRASYENIKKVFDQDVRNKENIYKKKLLKDIKVMKIFNKSTNNINMCKTSLNSAGNIDDYSIKELIVMKAQLEKPVFEKPQNKKLEIFNLTEYDSNENPNKASSVRKYQNTFEKYSSKEMWQHVGQCAKDNKKIYFPEIGIEKTPYFQKYSIHENERKVNDKKKFFDNLNAVKLS